MRVLTGRRRAAKSLSAVVCALIALAAYAASTAHAQNQAEPKVKLALTHEEIANMAGTSRETVTRLLNQFRRDQWITIKGSSLTITKPDQLERLTA